MLARFWNLTQLWNDLSDTVPERPNKEKSMIERPLVGISMGDPFGNGPEISVKAFNDKSLYDRCKPLIIGDRASMEYALAVARKVDGIDLKLNVIEKPEDGQYVYGTIDLISLNIIKPENIPNTLEQDAPQPFHIGASKLGGEASFQYVVYLIKLALDKKVDATVTNAFSKEAINMAGHHYSGHTEVYADYTHTKKYAMMLAHKNLRVVHVSTHVSLREACDRVKKTRVLDCIHMANDAMKALGIENPKIGVAGLNPHCGEDGMFGREEIEEIQPAIDEALKEGINIPEKKPTPPDTVFSKALGGWYDVVVVMYHDQGHIPCKVIGFVYDQEKHHWKAVEGINMTLGLPIIRVSVDHGTGFGHAGNGHANELSLVNAIDYAIRFAKNR